MCRTPEVAAVRLWVERVVIGLSLCPWAKPVHTERAALRFAHSNACCAEDLFAGVLHEVELLSPPCEHESSILVAPGAFPDDFLAFNDFVQDVEEYFRQERLDEDFQVVSFHPHFCFAGEDTDDAGNFVNRSPHPAIHLLRQADVTEAIDSHKDSLEVPQSNQRLLRRLGAAKLRELLSGARRDAIAEEAREEPP